MMKVTVVIVGKAAHPVDFPDNSDIERVGKSLVVAFGPGLLKRDGLVVVTDTLSGDYEFHLTGKIFSYHMSFFQ
jgi:hypothetical protein